MIILVDTREQLPMFTAPHAARVCLHAGDYTTANLLHKFHIERKSPADLYGTLTKGHRRFKNELWRAKDTDTKLVMLIECPHYDFVNKLFPRGEKLLFPTAGLRQMIETIKKRYSLEFIWCGDRNEAVDMLYKRLYKEEKLLRRLKAAKYKAHNRSKPSQR